jgi:hypothetical protein
MASADLISSSDNTLEVIPSSEFITGTDSMSIKHFPNPDEAFESEQSADLFVFMQTDSAFSLVPFTLHFKQSDNLTPFGKAKEQEARMQQIKEAIEYGQKMHDKENPEDAPRDPMVMGISSAFRPTHPTYARPFKPHQKSTDFRSWSDVYIPFDIN